MATIASLTIDQHLMSMLGRKLYTSHQAIICTRELLQNSIDACKKTNRKEDIQIKIEINDNWRDCTITCRDNGVGMSKTDIRDKFLKLGASGKRQTKDNENTGGFGIAKAALMSGYYWQVKSRQWVFDSDMLGKEDIQKMDDSIVGTQVICKMNSETIYNSVLTSIMAMVYLSDVKIDLRVIVDDTQIFWDNSAGLTQDKVYESSVNYDKTSGKIYLSRIPKIDMQITDVNFSGFCAIRLNGLVQFIIRQIDNMKQVALIDIETNYLPIDNEYPLSMSRESINYDIQQLINKKLKKYQENPLSTDSGWLTRNRKIKEKINHGQLIKRSFDNVNIPAIGNIEFLNETEESTIETNHKRLLRLYAAILQITTRDEKFMLTITDDSTVGGYRGYKNGYPNYAINCQLYETTIWAKDWGMDETILGIWELAAHESAHKEIDTHNEVFACEMGELMKNSAIRLTSNMPVLRTIIRNCDYWKK